VWKTALQLDQVARNTIAIGDLQTHVKTAFAFSGQMRIQRRYLTPETKGTAIEQSLVTELETHAGFCMKED
jgi:hypothetical protein